MKTLKQIREELAVEHNLHPQVVRIISDPKLVSKRTPELMKQAADVIKAHGEEPGFDTGNVPSGSSRGVLLSEGNAFDTTIDGQATSLPSAVKFVRNAPLDPVHEKLGNKKSLGTMQNEAENGMVHPDTGEELNNKFRVLSKNAGGGYSTNEAGVFPPLFYHDPNHQFSEVGHAPRIQSGTQFRELTKSDSHPKGLIFAHLISALEREWHKSRGSYHNTGPTNEAKLDAVTTHPMFKTLLQHQIETGTPPMDYSQQANWGVWTHPHTGKQHAVIVDHGYSDEVRQAYKDARREDHMGIEGEEWSRRRDEKEAAGLPTSTDIGNSWYRSVAANIKQKTNP